ncbi:MAG TPA: aldo/keto reductase, partial [Candidatus Binatia bacterium]|nr:aldo/keto reductase [Candidatus Binatia bacterium]
ETRAAVVRVRPGITLGVFALGLAASWVVFGTAFARMIEGMEPSSFVGPSFLVPSSLLLGAVLAWSLHVRRTVCGRCGPGRLFRVLPAARSAELLALPGRRRVLRQGFTLVVGVTAAAAGGLGAVVARNRSWLPVGRSLFVPVEKAAPIARPEWSGARIRTYRRLGRTGAMVSDISLGSSSIRSVDVARLALERGVTYFDTAPDYAHHGSEEILGEAMQGWRDRVFLASKFCTGHGHLPPETPVPEIIGAVEGSLRRLRTDRLDLLHVHSCDRVERVLAPNFHEAFDRMKEQGKVRFLGVSTHTPNLRAVANAAIDSGRFDVLMLAYHHGMGWDLEHILARAAEHDVAVVAMKTLKGAKHENLAPFRDEAASYTQAAFRWVLSNPHVSCLVVSFSELRHVDEYLYASGTQLTAADRKVLARYDELIAGNYCRPHCGDCLDSCVASLPINDILRYKMYFEDYRNEREAMRLYARLEGRDASLCVGCPAPCAGACPQGIPIRDKLLAAHSKLALT